MSGDTQTKVNLRSKPIDGAELLYFSLAEYFADIVTGRDKQDVALLLVAPKGYGKSYSALSLAYASARAVADRMGGTWEDYFPIDRKKNWLPNCAVISQTDMVQMVGITKQYNVYIMDDIGVGWNARRFQNNDNILLNDIFELMRIDNTIIILTVMDQFLIDKVPRSIIPFFAEVTEKHHDLGLNVIKIFKNKKQFRAGKLYHPYLVHNRYRYTRYICPAPPDEIAAAYDHMRTEKTREDRGSKVQEWLSSKEGEKTETLSSHELKWKEKCEAYGQLILERNEKGWSNYKIAKDLGMSKETVAGILSRMGV